MRYEKPDIIKRFVKKMKTKDEVASKIKELSGKPLAMWSIEVLVEFVSSSDIAGLINPGNEFEANMLNPGTAYCFLERVAEKFWYAVLDHDYITTKRCMAKMVALLWLMGREDVEEAMLKEAEGNFLARRGHYICASASIFPGDTGREKEILGMIAGVGCGADYPCGCSEFKE